MYPNFYLSFVLSKEKNNLNLVRLLAAMAVIYGHSFGLIPNPAGLDIIYHITGVYAAEWGVKTFFFLSGLLVVNSILSDRNVYSYMIKRVMRIWPALIFVVIGTVFIIGPINTQLPLNEYFSNTDLYFYIKSILTFDIFGKNNIGLPGIFEHNPFPVAVNAPGFCLCCYLGVISNRCIQSAFCVNCISSIFSGFFITRAPDLLVDAQRRF